MKFTKHQKETIKAILNGEIYDIYTYLKHFNLYEFAKYNKDSIINKFNKDPIPKVYYKENGLQSKASNTMTEQDYIRKLEQNEISSDNYTRVELELSYKGGIRKEQWEGETFVVNFYEGVFVAKSFNNILEFLTLWQYLKSEMLILEVPRKVEKNTLALFYEKTCNNNINDIPQSNRIDYDSFTYDDIYYLHSKYYTLSLEHCNACKEYIAKKLYPSPKLSLFVDNHFKTSDERSQNKNLFVAWVAIGVSIALSILPYFINENNDSEIIINELKSIKIKLDSNTFDDEICDKLNTLINKINSND